MLGIHVDARVLTLVAPSPMRQAARCAGHRRFVPASTMRHAIWICRVICPLLSQYVFLLAMIGSSIAG
jgi:hypothetical protein